MAAACIAACYLPYAGLAKGDYSMPNRYELVLHSAPPSASLTGTGEDTTAWALVWLCAAGWLISFYIAVTAEPADTIPLLLAQLPFG